MIPKNIFIHPISFAFALLLSPFLLFLTACDSSQNSKLTEFSADQVLEMPGQGKMIQKIYYAPGKVRIEQNTPMGKMVSIMLTEKGVTLLLNPMTKTYMEMPSQSSEEMGVVDTEQKAKMKKIGTDTVEGIKCTKYEMEGGKGTVCLAEGADIALKIEMDGGMSIYLQNIKPGQQDATLFQVPEGYSKQAMPAFGM